MKETGLLAYALAAAVACAASVAIARTAEANLAQRADEIARLRAAVDADDALTRQRVSLEQRDRMVRARLAGLLLPRDSTARVASFVHDAARISAAHRTVIAAIVPATLNRPVPAETARAASPSPSAAVPSTAQDDMAFDVTLDGQYADVLATVRGLASLTLPAAIDLTSIVRKSPGAPDTTVRSTIRVTLPDITAPAVRG
jgi:hypothetical protein